MSSESRTCRNCKKEFTIYPEDFAFYEKMQVPPPTFCPDCRLERRMTFRNERILYWKKCDAPGHNETILSLFSPGNPQRIYDQAFWWGDQWDPMVYGRNYNFSRNFFEQLRDLWREVPDVALMNQRGVSSEYCSITEGNKNCYLIIGGDFNENSLYSAFIFNCKECMDCYWISKSEFNYETVDCISSNHLFWSRYSEGCYDSYFMFNCRNCHDCFGCTNLNNKSYCIFNQEYSKEEYEKKLKELTPQGYQSLLDVKGKFRAESLKYPRKFAKVIRSVNSTGDDLEGAKNCRRSFSVFEGAEDSGYLWLIYSQVKGCSDCDHSGLNTERVVDSSTVYPGSGIYYSRFVRSCRDIYYSYNCHDSSDLFGCVGLRNKQYCIFNKEYSEEEYEKLVPQIRKHMDDMPYIDKGGRRYGYGEFFPSEISPFSYNETVAAELHPLSYDEAMKLGYKWHELSEKQYNVTLKSEDLPDTIAEVRDSILNEVISCAHGGKCNDQCATAFKVTPPELEFYRKFNLPMPRLCSNCRHYERIRQRNPLKLWKRKCQCAGSTSSPQAGTNYVYKNTAEHKHGDSLCGVEFETTYAPEKPEIVYCETCYQAEVI